MKDGCTKKKQIKIQAGRTNSIYFKCRDGWPFMYIDFYHLTFRVKKKYVELKKSTKS